jgi:hypothetical protein
MSKKESKYVFTGLVLAGAVFPIELLTETAFLESLESKEINIGWVDRAL